MQPFGYIYLTTNLQTKRIYIGQSTVLHPYKIATYLGSGYRLKKSIHKRGRKFFTKRILGYCYSKQELNEAEKICIEFYQSNNKIYGYNVTPGGEGGGMIGKKFSEETLIKKRKQVPWNKGLKGSQTPWNKGLKGVLVPWNKGLHGEVVGLGKPKSEACKQKMREHIKTQEHIQKIINNRRRNKIMNNSQLSLNI